ncbi:fasciclin domain-containing protein [Candidatus Saccharibacteria bacterium CPR2]|nr:fasciclin domain-containing protein [Candidatus Saccharibacteria bacterium CPR2]
MSIKKYTKRIKFSALTLVYGIWGLLLPANVVFAAEPQSPEAGVVINAPVEISPYPSDIVNPQADESANNTDTQQAMDAVTDSPNNTTDVDVTKETTSESSDKSTPPQSVAASVMAVPVTTTKLYTDVIKPNTDLSTLSSVIEALSLEGYFDTETLTVFGPNNEAFAYIPEAEVNELSSNSEQLQEFLSNHVLQTKMFSVDLTDGQVLTSLAGLNLQVNIIGSDIFINGEKVLVPDQAADNGALHIMAGVLLPNNPQVTINNFETNKVSPSLSGTICEGAETLTVRINGVSYNADTYINTEDNTWTIPEGVVTVDPLSENTLFSLVTNCPQNNYMLRAISDFSEEENENDSEIALTMRDDVMKYKSSETDSGNVLGSSTNASATPVALASSVTTPVAQYSQGGGCGKGVCGEDLVAQAGPGFVDENQNGIPDDQEQQQSADEGKTDEGAAQDTRDESAEDQASWWWWVAGFGTVGVLWYLLWRKSGKENE